MGKTTRQQTFGDVSVNKFSGKRRCDTVELDEENGGISRCIHGADITILRPGNDVAEFYCKYCSKDTWLDIADIQE